MNEPTIALVFTPDPWVEDVHRHCTDHGGARIRQVLIDPGLALEEQYDVLVVGHRWPALTHGFVDDLHARGRKVLGVYEREESAGRDFLRAVGVDAAVTSDAGPDGIVALLRAVHGDAALDAVARAAADDEASVMRGAITAVSGPAGAGATEVAIALTSAFGTRAVLVDADDVAPAVAPRLGLPIEPNLRDAIDAVEYGDGELDAFVAPRANGLCVVGGLASATAWTQIRPPEMLRLVQRLATGGADRVVLDVAGALEDMPVATARPRHAVARALLGEADEIVAVGAATPVGVTRLLAWIADARAFASPSALHVVVNRAPKDAFRRGEIVDEIANAFAVASVTVVPNDRRVEAAAWAGALVGRGPFTRAVAALASELGRVDAGHRIAS